MGRIVEVQSVLPHLAVRPVRNDVIDDYLAFCAYEYADLVYRIPYDRRHIYICVLELIAFTEGVLDVEDDSSVAFRQHVPCFRSVCDFRKIERRGCHFRIVVRIQGIRRVFHYFIGNAYRSRYNDTSACHRRDGIEDRCFLFEKEAVFPCSAREHRHAQNLRYGRSTAFPCRINLDLCERTVHLEGKCLCEDEVAFMAFFRVRQFPEGIHIQRLGLHAVHRNSRCRGIHIELEGFQFGFCRGPGKCHGIVLICHGILIGNKVEFHIMHS